MEELFLPLLVAVTSMGAYLIGLRVLGLSRRGLGWALRQTLEMVGLTVVFLVANLAIGLAVILTTRALSMRFVSVYILNDASLVALSALQGMILGWWRRQGGN
jgi:hypothetical protein